jgi:hypothetical protein
MLSLNLIALGLWAWRSVVLRPAFLALQQPAVGLFEPYCAEIPCRWLKDISQFVGQFLFESYTFGGGPQFDTFVQN